MRAAVIVPVYNNGQTIASVVRGARQHCDTVIVVDDGSADTTADELDAIAISGVTVIRHAVNRDKGAALATGVDAARQLGCDLAITIDGDGQHDPDDIRQVLAAAAKNPGALICGVRRMDHLAGDVPKSSRFGRMFSNFWVWCETGLRLSDTQSGFRAYPLNNVPWEQLATTRYDFEIEVITRSVWSGVKVVEVAVGVHYPPRQERISHFDPVVDNFRLTLIHTRLVTRRIFLGRSKRAARQLDTRWDKAPERAGATVLGFCVEVFGQRACYAFLPLVLMFYYVTGGAARRATAHFYRRLGLSSRWAIFWAGFRNFLFFSMGLIDRLALAKGALSWHDHVVSVEGRNVFDRGVILLGAHFGDWSLCGSELATKNGKPVHVVMNPRHNPAYSAMIAQLMGERFRFIDIMAGGFAVAMAVREVIDAGGIVCFMADRGLGNAPVIPLDFLGAPAAFPRSPFDLARVLECPVHAFYCLKSGLRSSSPYMVYSRELWNGSGKPTAEELAARFRDDLAVRVAAAPHQWFNFFDFWPQRFHDEPVSHQHLAPRLDPA